MLYNISVKIKIYGGCPMYTTEEVAKSNKGYTPKFLREELKIN